MDGRAVRLPESFRGGCSFGAGPILANQADLSRAVSDGDHDG